MVVTVKKIVDVRDAGEPVIVEDEYGKCLYDGRFGDVPESLHKRVVKLAGWLMVAQKNVIKVEAEPDGEFSTISEYDYKLGEFWTRVSFELSNAAWKKLKKTAEWKAFLKYLGKAQEE